MSMKVLLTSVGRRSYMINYFKEAVGSNGEIHVSNSTDLTPAFTYADKSIVSPLIYDPEYIPFLLEYCSSKKINAVISLFDIDLPILTKSKHLFKEIGTQVIVSNEHVIKTCNDKLETYNFLKECNYKTAKTYNSLETAIAAVNDKIIDYPLIIKPRWGMGSIGVYEAENEQELKVLYRKVLASIKQSYLKYESNTDFEKSVIIQEKLQGQEYGLDIINDLEGNYQNTVVKKKYAMRSGETDCAKIVNLPFLKQIGESISKDLKHISNLDVDVFFDGENPYILEINARFGGGYPFSHMAGVNLPLAIIKWLNKENVDKSLLIEQPGVIAHKDINMVSLDPLNLQTETNANEINLIRVKEEKEIVKILEQFDTVFNPSISDRIPDFTKYADKLKKNANVFVATLNKRVLGFIAFYSNNYVTRIAYLTFIAVDPSIQSRNVGKKLLNLCIETSQANNMEYLKLEVQKKNIKAIRFYEKFGFQIEGDLTEDSINMIKKLEKS